MQFPTFSVQTISLPFFRTPNRPSCTVKWLDLASRWNSWMPILRLRPVYHRASGRERRKVTAAANQVSFLGWKRYHVRRHLARGWILPSGWAYSHLRRGQVLAREKGEVHGKRTGDDESLFSFVLSVTEPKGRRTIPQKPTTSSVASRLAVRLNELGAQPADGGKSHSAQDDLFQTTQFMEASGEGEDRSTERLQSRLLSEVGVMKEDSEDLSSSRENFKMQGKPKLINDRKDREATRLWPSAATPQSDRHPQFRHPSLKWKRGVEAERTCSWVQENEAERATSPHTKTGHYGMCRVRGRLKAFGEYHAKWTKKFMQRTNNPLYVVCLYRLLTECPAATQRWRGLLSIMDRVLLERLHHLHINDIATLTSCMKQVGHLRTDFLLAASPLVAAHANRASARSCCILLDSYAALRFSVGHSVEALCRALASSANLSLLTVPHIALAFGSLARLNIRSEYLLMALSEQILNCWRLDPARQSLTKVAGQESSLLMRVSSEAITGGRKRVRSGASAPILHSVCEEQLAPAIVKPPQPTDPPLATSVEVPSQTTPSDVVLLLYGIIKLQWYDPRLLLPLLQAGIPVCVSRMHAHQLVVAAVALSRLVQPPNSTTILENKSFAVFTAAAGATVRAADALVRAKGAEGASCKSRSRGADVGERLKKEATKALELIVCEACHRIPQFKADVRLASEHSI